MKKKFTLNIGGIAILMFVGCSTEFDPCVCYDDALKTDDKSTLEQQCQDLIEEMDEEAIKKASTKCFTDDVGDLTGTGS